MTLLYLHGFRSSPASYKARIVEQRMAALGCVSDLICPQLPASPAQAVTLALDLVQGVPVEELAVVGSSLGGFYATYIAEKLGCRAVLVNPSVDPLKNLSKNIGITTAWHSDTPFEFKQEYLAELAALQVAQITDPARYFLLAATGDEVLDYRDMTAHYAGARQHVIQGGDHAVSNFEVYVDEVLAFCGVDISR
jgi:predicted esterase YcpF (UPF0227 family)